MQAQIIDVYSTHALLAHGAQTQVISLQLLAVVNRSSLQCGLLGQLGVQLELRYGRAGSSSPPALTLVEANRLVQLCGLLESATQIAHPVLALAGISTEPVLGGAAEHDAAQFALPATALFFALCEGVLCEVSGGCLHVVRVVPCSGGGVGSDVLAEALAGEGQHDEDKVDAKGPEAGDEGDGHDTSALEDGVAESGATICALPDCYGVLAGLHALGRLGDDVNLRDVVLGACEARVVLHTGRQSSVLIGVCGECVEPCDAEEGCVQGVDDRVERIEMCQEDRLKGTL